MPYTKTQWNEGAAPGVSAETLNKIEQGIADAAATADTGKATADAAKATADAALPKAGGTISGDVVSTARMHVGAHTEFGYAPGVTLAIGDNDTGINWEGDGRLAVWANSQIVGYLFADKADFQKPLQQNGQQVWHSGNAPGAGRFTWTGSRISVDGGGNNASVSFADYSYNADVLDGYHAVDLVRWDNRDAGAKIIPVYSAGSFVYTSSTILTPSVAHSTGAGIDLRDYRFLWESSIAANRTIYFEAVFRVNSGAGIIALHDSGGGAIQLSTTSTSSIRVRSGAIGMGSGEYHIQMLGAGTVYLYEARLVII